MPSHSRYTWNLDRLQFRDTQTGRYVSPDRVFQQVNRVIDVSERRIVKLADQVRTRAITIDQFKLAMRTEIKSLHIATSIASNGGLSQMTPSRWGKVGATLRREYGYLDKFTMQLATGKLPLDSGRVRSRSRSYASNARLEYWYTLNARLEQSGREVDAARKLGAVETEHCSGCVTAAGKWMPLAKLPAIGVFACKWFCGCSILYKLGQVKPLTGPQGSSLDARVRRATRTVPLPATELPITARSRLDRHPNVRREKINGRHVYYFHEQPERIL